MATKVATKGQVVIDRDIREQLGIQPGMLAIQQVVGDHVEIRFVLGEHNRSQAGAARPFVRRWPSAEELDDTDELWAEEARRHLPPNFQERRG